MLDQVTLHTSRLDAVSFATSPPSETFYIFDVLLQLTLAEIREAKEKKEAMLRSSIRDFRMSPVTLPDEE